MKFKIVADSGANLREIDSRVDYAVVPLTITTADREFVDDKSLDINEMITYLKQYKGKSGTACPGVGDWMDAFGDAEGVFCVTITSGLSGSCNAARLAKEDYEEMYPDRHVYVVDSLSAGSEMNLIIEKLAELIEQEESFEAICDKIAVYQKNTGLMFSLESLTNLANNGRVNPLVAKIAGTLGICVVGKASDKGTLEQMAKCRGERKALHSLFQFMKELGYEGGKVSIDHCNNMEAAEKLQSMLLQEFPQTNVKIGCTDGLCSFYAEGGGLLVGFEKGK